MVLSRPVAEVQANRPKLVKLSKEQREEVAGMCALSPLAKLTEICSLGAVAAPPPPAPAAAKQVRCMIFSPYATPSRMISSSYTLLQKPAARKRKVLAEETAEKQSDEKSEEAKKPKAGNDKKPV
jgi:hypothetical protein